MFGDRFILETEVCLKEVWSLVTLTGSFAQNSEGQYLKIKNAVLSEVYVFVFCLLVYLFVGGGEWGWRGGVCVLVNGPWSISI